MLVNIEHFLILYGNWNQQGNKQLLFTKGVSGVSHKKLQFLNISKLKIAQTGNIERVDSFLCLQLK
jgi:hypothetical protein